MKKHQMAYLHTGSNQGDRADFLHRARMDIEESIGKVTQASNLYETAAWGLTDQPDFLNQALEVQTECSPTELLEAILKIEIKLGRERLVKWSARTVDIDILFYDQQIMTDPKLTIPHRHLHERNFVLIPLMEIAPYFVHPVFELSIEELYLQSKDLLDVRLLS